MTSTSVRGGLARVLETLVRHQAERHQVSVVSPVAPQVERSLAVSWREATVLGNSDMRGMLRMLRTMRQLQPDVVLHHSGAPGELALTVALLSRMVPVVVVEHAPQHEPRGTPLRDLIFARLNRRADRWVSVSAAGGAALEDRWALEPGTLRCVHCGVEDPGLGVLETETEDLDVVALARPSEAKGFGTFCRVADHLAAKHHRARWCWVGGDAPRREGSVEVLPWVTHVGTWLSRAAMLLVPSRAEGIPLVVLEAMACGCPVVASRVGGVPEAIEDGVNGVLVEPEDTVGWVRAVDALLRDPTRRAALGAAGRAAWEAHWTAEAMVSRFEALIAEVVEVRR